MDTAKLIQLSRRPTACILTLAVGVLLLDQLTKTLVMRYLPAGQEKILLDGFFRFVNWHNTGAAWSLFMGRNRALAVVAIAALVVLYRSRHFFDAHTRLGQLALGLIFGGIVGNLIDRLRFEYVVDFLRFYILPRGGEEIGFPAFNIADSAICIGVGLIFILSFKPTPPPPEAARPAA